MYVYCLPAYVKANKYLLSSASGTLKEAEQRSITVKYLASGGTFISNVCGFVLQLANPLLFH